MPRRAAPTDARRLEAVRAIVDGGRTLRPVAREIGVSHVQLRRWVLSWRLAHEASPARCAVCGKAPKLPRVDRDAQGRPRAVLCQLCTIALRAVNEDPIRADALATYARACGAFARRS